MAEGWEWFDEVPSTDEVIEKLKGLPAVWGRNVVDYMDYVLPMTKRQKMERDGKEEYVAVTKLYMQVAGRIKMLEHAQDENDWSVTEEWEIVHADPVVMRCTISVSIGTNPFGSRSGIAKAKGGDNAWEKMETAARGRALGAWGFGVLPGSGMASAEEMEFVGVDLTEETKETKERARTKPELIEEVLTIRSELATVRGQEIEDLDDRLRVYAKQRYGKELGDVDGVLDLTPLKDGQLVLMHNDLVQQLKKARADEERMIE